MSTMCTYAPAGEDCLQAFDEIYNNSLCSKFGHGVGGNLDVHDQRAGL
jgi:hypothetical protein